MERVLTIKANFFAEEMGYDIYIILTDGKGKEPFYPLSAKVNIVHLDINFNELWDKPLCKKGLIYIKKQRLYKNVSQNAYLKYDRTLLYLCSEEKSTS